MGISPTGAKTDTIVPKLYSIVTPTFTVDDVAINETVTFDWIAPASGRFLEASIRTQTTTSDPTWAVTNATDSTNIVAAENMPASATTRTVAAASLTNRNFDKGDVIRVQIVADAVDDVAEGVCVVLTAVLTDHVVAAAAAPDFYKNF